MSKNSRISETAAHSDQTVAEVVEGNTAAVEGEVIGATGAGASASVPAVVEPTRRSLSDLARPREILNFGGLTFEVAAPVTLPVLKQKSGETVFFRIDKAISYEIKTDEQLASEGKTRGSKDDKPVPVLTVTELRSGEQFKYVGNAIFVSELERQYPQVTDPKTGELGEWGYVSKFFGVKKLEQREGKRYKDLQVVELVPTGDQGAARAEPIVDSTQRA